MPFLPAPLSVTAITMARWPFLPLVTNCLTPLMTQPSASFNALVRRAEASLPTCAESFAGPGSVALRKPQPVLKWRPSSLKSALLLMPLIL